MQVELFSLDYRIPARLAFGKHQGLLVSIQRFLKLALRNPDISEVVEHSCLPF